MNKFNNYINKLKYYFEKIKEKDYLIYDTNNNYKLYYIKQLRYLRNYMSIQKSINLFNIIESDII